jgi:hypothetical protein
MLLDFQQALADISASADWCSTLRVQPQRLEERYALSPRERRQLLAVAHHPGMDCVCGLYRMNRLGPLVQNLPSLLAALGEGLQGVLLAYWEAHPWRYSHGYVECQRFCRWLYSQPLAEALRPVLEEEERELQRRIQRVLDDVA